MPDALLSEVIGDRGVFGSTMVLFHFVLCCAWLILSWISEGSAEKRSYMNYEMNVICKQFNSNFKIRMHHTNAGSTGVLMATGYLSDEEETECVAVITPPKGYGVIYNIERLELRKDANNDCRDYIKISNETSRSNASQPVCRDCCRFTRSPPSCAGHCGYESDGLVCEEFCDRNNASSAHLTGSSARSLIVHYHTRCATCTDRREAVGFKMIFTAYRLNTVPGASCGLQNEFQCDNGRCIWVGLTCDGYNNCGDNSDENSAGSSHCAEFPDPMKAVIVASAVIVTVFLGVVLAYLPKMSLHALLGRKRTQPTFRMPAVHYHKSSIAPLIVKKTSNPKSVSFQTPLPKIREVSDDLHESQV